MWRFAKAVKEPSVPKLKVDKPSTRSPKEYKNKQTNKKTTKNEAQTNFELV